MPDSLTYIIVTRNPSNRKLLAITDDECTDAVMEFDTEEAAAWQAARIPVCEAWGYHILPISVNVRHSERIRCRVQS